MANKTNNYKFPRPEADDFYDISEYNKTMDILDDSLTEMDQKKLDKNGDASEAVTEFEQEILRENIESGETLSVIHGKVKKWFSEMKDVVFSGHAKDLTTDAAHRFVSDTEKSSWNGKVAASGGDISETVINNLENIKEKYPIPGVGESTKVFIGKVKKYIENTKPLDKSITVYVATTGSDTTGNGTSTNPFKTIQRTMDTIPKDMNGYVVDVKVADGTYLEDVEIKGFYGGTVSITSTLGTVLSDACKINSIYCYNVSARIYIAGINLISTSRNTFWGTNCTDIILQYVTAKSTSTYTGFHFDACRARLEYCLVANHAIGFESYNSICRSVTWNTSSTGNTVGIRCSESGFVYIISTQPSGTTQSLSQSGMFIQQNGTQISNLITSDLSCTWGTITDGGYVRHGNINGYAVVTLGIRVEVTSVLSSNVTYYISGFPTASMPTAVCCHAANHFVHSVLGGDGKIYLSPSMTIPVGNVYHFSATYLTSY